VWAFLCERDAIPTKAQPAVVLLATARLEDKSGQVGLTLVSPHHSLSMPRVKMTETKGDGYLGMPEVWYIVVRRCGRVQYSY
jgi:hypothetical protein